MDLETDAYLYGDDLDLVAAALHAECGYFVPDTTAALINALRTIETLKERVAQLEQDESEGD